MWDLKKKCVILTFRWHALKMGSGWKLYSILISSFFFSANISKYKILFVNLLSSFTAKNIAVTLKFACLVLLLDVNYLICLDEKLWRLLVLNVKAFSLKTYNLKAFLSFCFFFSSIDTTTYSTERSEHFKPCKDKDLAYCLNEGECFVIETLTGSHKHCR